MSGDEATPPRKFAIPRAVWIVGGIALLAIGLVYEIRQTRPVRDAVRTYTDLISAANRRDLVALRSLCTDRYAAHHAFKLADEGGVIGFPRNIHKNFQAWREGNEVWLCPTNRVGPVFWFVEDGDRVEPMEDESETRS